MSNTHHEAFLRSLHELERTQRDLLSQRILIPNAQTDYGQRFDFAAISDAETYRNQVPLIDYEAIRESIDRMAQGDSNVLIASPCVAFFQTSGSQSSPKLVPVTGDSMREKVSAFSTFWGQVYVDHPAVRSGPMVSNFSDASESMRSAAGLEITSESGFWARRGRSLHSLSRWPLPADVRKIDDAAARLYATARLLLQSDLCCIMCLNPSTLLQFCAVVERHADELSSGLADGLWGASDASICKTLESDHAQVLARHLSSDPERATRLVASTVGKTLSLKALWPELELIICWSSAMVRPYLDRLAPYIDGIAMRDYITQASECVMAIPLDDGSSGGTLAYQSHFFEFIPESQVDRAQPETRFAWQLEEGEHYELVVSTAGGLYRYRMQDCVRVQGHRQSVPVIEFLYRTGKTSSITGEKLTECQVLEAADRAVVATEFQPGEFLCFPVTEPWPHYGLLVDAGSSTVGDDRIVSWMQTFERYLCEANPEYRDKCASGRLGALQAYQVPEGSLLQARMQRRARGVSQEQVKSEVLSRELDYHRQIPEARQLS